MQEEIKNIIRHDILIKVTKSVTKNFLPKTSRFRWFLWWIFSDIKFEIILIKLTESWKKMFSNLFYEGRMILLWPDNNFTRKKID